MKIHCCVITANVPACVTKEFSLVAGQLQKKTTASVYQGHMQVCGFDTSQQFANLLSQLRTDQCLTYGAAKRCRTGNGRNMDGAWQANRSAAAIESRIHVAYRAGNHDA